MESRHMHEDQQKLTGQHGMTDEMVKHLQKPTTGLSSNESLETRDQNKRQQAAN